MNCLDCGDLPSPAVAMCARCGAGLCSEHVVVRDETLTVRVPINRPVAVWPPARRLRCARCDAAEQAQARGITPAEA
jgi:hypothetical protein